jgi:hypothetical protein
MASGAAGETAWRSCRRCGKPVRIGVRMSPSSHVSPSSAGSVRRHVSPHCTLLPSSYPHPTPSHTGSVLRSPSTSAWQPSRPPAADRRPRLRCPASWHRAPFPFRQREASPNSGACTCPEARSRLCVKQQEACSVRDSEPFWCEHVADE